MPAENLWFTLNCHDCGRWYRFDNRDERAAFVRGHDHNNLVMDDINALRHPHYGELRALRVPAVSIS